MNVIETIKRKTAIREYSANKVPLEIILKILDSGRHAQSSRNSQPWRFLVIRREEILQALSRLGNYASHLAEASFGIAILTPDPANNVSILFDAGQAAAYLQLAALDFDVVSCIVKLHEGGKANPILGVPSDYQLDFMIAFGYPIEPHRIITQRERARLTIDQVAYFDRWGLGLVGLNQNNNKI